MGERPKGMTLDRVDVNGNYEPGNCRWATSIEQRQNQRPKKHADLAIARRAARSAYRARKKAEQARRNDALLNGEAAA